MERYVQFNMGIATKEDIWGNYQQNNTQRGIDVIQNTIKFIIKKITNPPFQISKDI